jgi:hypothetical protein
MTSSKPHTVQGGAGSAWLFTAAVGCLFTAGFTRLILWSSGGHAPTAVGVAFWVALIVFGVVIALIALTATSRRRPATYGVEPLTIADRRRLAAEFEIDLDTGVGAGAVTVTRKGKTEVTPAMVNQLQEPATA